MPSLNEWWNQNPQLHDQPEAAVARAFMNEHKKKVSQANAAFIEQERIEEQIRQLQRNQNK